MIALGLTASEILDYTPYQLSRLMRRHCEQERVRARNMAIMTASYLNHHRDASLAPFDVESFMPYAAEGQAGEYNESQQHHHVQQSTEEQLSTLRQWAMANGATVVKRNAS